MDEVLNLNDATAEELSALDGVDEALAEAIVSYRADEGTFMAVEDLWRVPAMTEDAFDALLSAGAETGIQARGYSAGRDGQHGHAGRVR